MNYFKLKRKLTDALLECRSVHNQQIWNAIVAQLPNTLRESVMGAPIHVEVISIINVCFSYDNGLDKFIEIVRFFERGTIEMQEVDKVVEEIKPAIQKYQHSHSKKHSVTALLARERSVQEKPPSLSKEPLKVDRDVILKTDLSKFRKALFTHLRPNGAFAFSVGGKNTSSAFLEHYILERIFHDLRAVCPDSATKRSREQVNLYLNHDILAGQDPPEFERLAGLFSLSPVEIALVVWNDDYPLNHIQTFAASLWRGLAQNASSFLKDKDNRFVMIWINEKDDALKLDEFVPLPLPECFECSEIELHFRDEFSKYREKITEHSITNYIKRLIAHNGHLVRTYRVMEDIVQELQRGRY